MNYTQFKQEQEKKYNEFPFLFAFSDKQLEEGKEKLGVKENKELLSIGQGAFIRKKDIQAFKDLVDTFDKEKTEFLKDEKNLQDALEYELANHEYCITYSHEPTLEVLGLSFESLTDRQKEILKKAKENCLKE